MIAELESEMFAAAEALDFERAAFLRDKLKELKDIPEMKELAAPAAPTTKKTIKLKQQNKRKK
jgi:excinuclease UvrABC nuclease subunit